MYTKSGAAGGAEGHRNLAPHIKPSAGGAADGKARPTKHGQTSAEFTPLYLQAVLGHRGCPAARSAGAARRGRRRAAASSGG